jgi:hypothetical protein
VRQQARAKRRLALAKLVVSQMLERLLEQALSLGLLRLRAVP